MNEMQRVYNLVQFVYAVNLKYCDDNSPQHSFGGSSLQYGPHTDNDLVTVPDATSAAKYSDASLKSTGACVPKSPELTRHQTVKDVAKLYNYAEMSRTPLRFAALENMSFDEAVKDSFSLLGNDSLSQSNWQSLANELEPTRQKVAAALPPDASPALRNAKIVVTDNDPAAFLVAEAPSGDPPEIWLSPGMVRAFFALCRPSMLGLYNWYNIHKNCSPDGRNYSPQNVMDSARFDVCSDVRRMNNADMDDYSSVFKDCINAESEFVIAHEFAHIYLRHSIDFPKREMRADDCARVLLGEKKATLGGYGVEILKDMLSSRVFALSDDQRADAQFRLDRMRKTISDDSVGCAILSS